MTKKSPAGRVSISDPPTAAHHARLRTLLWTFLAAFSVIALRLVQLQVAPHVLLTDEYASHVGHDNIPIPRGDIRDRNGRLLATDQKSPSLTADPSVITDAETLARQLAGPLAMEVETLYEKLTLLDGKGRPMKFVYLKRWLKDSEVKALKSGGLLPHAGLAFQDEPMRSYPEGDLAAHVIGFANREGVGGAGVELSFDKYLKSIPGRRVSRVDAKRNFVSHLTLEYEPPRGGDHVIMTIDSSLQYTLERRLDQALQDAKAPRAMGLLMDPHTGAILAMAVRPAYDPNYYSEYEAEHWNNSAVTDVFEPGSSFKIVTTAAAIEHGLISMGDLIDCEGGSFNPYGHRIRDTHELDVVPFWTAFSQSSNVATIKVAAMLGPERLEDWVKRFGFGSRTSPDFPSESAGIFHPRSRWSRLSMGSLPIGQEISVTLPQLARAFAAIANGGYLVEPYLVERAVSRRGETTYRHDPGAPRRILSEQTAATMRALCEVVVNHEDGTGTYASIREFRAGGKTGTGQIAKPGGGGYYRDKYTTVFAGFAPVSNPRICAVIVVPEPNIRLHYGGYVCGPIFKDVVREALIRLNVPEEPVAKVAANTRAGRDADVIAARFDMSFMDPAQEEDLDSLELVKASRELQIGEDTLPNLVGLTKRQAYTRLVKLGVNWDPRGAGWVVHQDPAPGTPIGNVSVCRLSFSTRPERKDSES